MFDFGNANEGQRAAISAADGPVLITAGPGTGKTYTLVQRTIYLIEECGVKPESIFIATFTEKAAKELITRITNELSRRDITVNINEMYVGTFHSLCLRILKEHLEYTRLRKNYRLLDAFDQQYMVFQNIYRFRNIPEVDILLPNGGAWKQSETICSYVNNLSEEMVSPDDLIGDADNSIVAMGRILKEYREILNEGNLMDFSSIQIEAYQLLNDHPEVLNEMHSQITHIMVDEYQDTNFIQEQLVFLLAGERNNICVVGDDDQGLYRFRGATIRNILEFPQKFPSGECRIIPLVINYRSNSDIVDFYNEWMATTSGEKFKFEWENFRYDKRIIPHEKSSISSPAVVKLSGKDDIDEWHENVLGFIKRLEESGKLSDYNQIAFLFSSVKHPRVTELAKFLEANHINVYSPRSDMFFQREEVRLTLGCLMLLFPVYIAGLENGEYGFLKPEHITYYSNCIKLANNYLIQPEHSDLKKWIRMRGKEHLALNGTTDYAYSGLLYQMFQFAPFSTILDTDMDVGVVDIRPSRNLAKLTQIVGKFEYLHRIDVLDSAKYRGKRRIDQNTEILFNLYLKLLIDGGITVYETCARQYKFYKELEFMPVRANAMLFGTLVHETIEDVHKAALRHEEQTITEENVGKWFDSNYVSLTKSEHTYLAGPQRETALKQVLRYVERQHEDWSKIQQAEVEVSLVKPDYIIDGKIDLIKGEGDTVEIVDFKSEHKPDMEKMRDRLEQYRRQLNIYAYLVEQRTGKKVSKMNLYYTAEENGVPTITYPYQKTAVEGTMEAFDDTVHKIMKKDFHRCADDPKICKNCDFRFYCMNK